jgi:hypothetical protein
MPAVAVATMVESGQFTRLLQLNSQRDRQSEAHEQQAVCTSQGAGRRTSVVDAHAPPQHGLQAPDLRQAPVLRPQPPQRPGHKHLASGADSF